MSDTIDMRIVVKPYSKEAEQRVLDVDLEDYYINGKFAIDNTGQCKLIQSVEDDRGYSIMYSIIKKLAEALGDEGWAYITVKSDFEFVESCITYCYLGAKIRVLSFCDCDDPEYIYDCEGILGELLKLPDDDIRNLYNEILDEDAVDIGDEPTERIICWIIDCLGEYDEYWTECNGPYATALFKAVAETAKKCSYSEGLFTPSIRWEEKGIVRFTEKEKEALTI